MGCRVLRWAVRRVIRALDGTILLPLGVDRVRIGFRVGGGLCGSCLAGSDSDDTCDDVSMIDVSVQMSVFFLYKAICPCPLQRPYESTDIQIAKRVANHTSISTTLNHHLHPQDHSTTHSAFPQPAQPKAHTVHPPPQPHDQAQQHDPQSQSSPSHA